MLTTSVLEKLWIVILGCWVQCCLCWCPYLLSLLWQVCNLLRDRFQSLFHWWTRYFETHALRQKCVLFTLPCGYRQDSTISTRKEGFQENWNFGVVHRPNKRKTLFTSADVVFQLLRFWNKLAYLFWMWWDEAPFASMNVSG